MLKWGFGSGLLALLFAPLGAVTSVAASWSPSPVQLVIGGDVNATLAISGVFNRSGYSVRLYTENATDQTTSELIHSTTATGLSYTASMTPQSIVSPASVVTELLQLNRVQNNDLKETLSIGGREEHEVFSSSPHEVVLTFHLDAFDPITKIAGTYSEILTAEVVIN